MRSVRIQRSIARASTSLPRGVIGDNVSTSRCFVCIVSLACIGRCAQCQRLVRPARPVRVEPSTPRASTLPPCGVMCNIVSASPLPCISSSTCSLSHVIAASAARSTRVPRPHLTIHSRAPTSLPREAIGVVVGTFPLLCIIDHYSLNIARNCSVGGSFDSRDPSASNEPPCGRFQLHLPCI